MNPASEARRSPTPDPVREHLQDLRASGMTLEQISRAGGVSVATLLRAAKAPRISTAAADAILGVHSAETDPAAAATERCGPSMLTGGPSSSSRRRPT